jgi:uncharacterized membrane protein YjgN (DUF898 family)
MDLETAPAAPVIEAHRLKFTGDGGVYFGVWIVNLLLMVVTFGLYTPFARRRTLKYFYAHSVVAGSPLEFTGGLKRMFLGFLLFAALYLAYSIAANTEQDVAAGLLMVFWLGLTPWLWASATRFRLGSTRWRGIHFHFQAKTREAYGASWPFLAAIALAAIVGFAGYAAKDSNPNPFLVLGIALAAMLGYLALLVLVEFNYTRLRMERSDFGGQRSRWKGELGTLLRITAAAAGLFFAVVAAAALVIGLAAGGSIWLLRDMVRGGGSAMVLVFIVATVFFMLAGYLSASPAMAYREARKFAMVWDHAGLGNMARFTTTLTPWPFVRLRLKNVILTLITFGFWRPFALVAEYRMKLESVTLHVKGGLEPLVGHLVAQQGEFGDAIADAVGFDVVG